MSSARKQTQPDLMALYRLEFYRKQKDWKLGSDVRKKAAKKKSSATRNVLNKTYNIEVPITDAATCPLNEAFIESASDMATTTDYQNADEYVHQEHERPPNNWPANATNETYKYQQLAETPSTGYQYLPVSSNCEESSANWLKSNRRPDNMLNWREVPTWDATQFQPAQQQVPPGAGGRQGWADESQGWTDSQAECHSVGDMATTTHYQNADEYVHQEHERPQNNWTANATNEAYKYQQLAKTPSTGDQYLPVSSNCEESSANWLKSNRRPDNMLNWREVPTWDAMQFQPAQQQVPPGAGGRQGWADESQGWSDSQAECHSVGDNQDIEKQLEFAETLRDHGLRPRAVGPAPTNVEPWLTNATQHGAEEYSELSIDNSTAFMRGAHLVPHSSEIATNSRSSALPAASKQLPNITPELSPNETSDEDEEDDEEEEDEVGFNPPPSNPESVCDTFLAGSFKNDVCASIGPKSVVETGHVGVKGQIDCLGMNSGLNQVDMGHRGLGTQNIYHGDDIGNGRSGVELSHDGVNTGMEQLLGVGMHNFGANAVYRGINRLGIQYTPAGVNMGIDSLTVQNTPVGVNTGINSLRVENTHDAFNMGINKVGVQSTPVGVNMGIDSVRFQNTPVGVNTGINSLRVQNTHDAFNMGINRMGVQSTPVGVNMGINRVGVQYTPVGVNIRRDSFVVQNSHDGVNIRRDSLVVQNSHHGVNVGINSCHYNVNTGTNRFTINSNYVGVQRGVQNTNHVVNVGVASQGVGNVHHGVDRPVDLTVRGRGRFI